VGGANFAATLAATLAVTFIFLFLCSSQEKGNAIHGKSQAHFGNTVHGKNVKVKRIFLFFRSSQEKGNAIHRKKIKAHARQLTHASAGPLLIFSVGW